MSELISRDCIPISRDPATQNQVAGILLIREAENRMHQIRAAAVLDSMLDLIGKPEATDHDMARLLVESEPALRLAVRSLRQLIGSQPLRRKPHE